MKVVKLGIAIKQNISKWLTTYVIAEMLAFFKIDKTKQKPVCTSCISTIK